MNDILQLPQRFKVNKQLKSDYFIEYANLTPAETKELKPYLNHVSILYEVKFADESQLVFLEIVIGCYYYEYTFRKIAKAIATAIPHRVILLIRYQDRTQIVAFNSRVNSRDSYRRSVQSFDCSPYFWAENPDRIDIQSLRSIEGAVIDSKTATECNERIIEIIKDWKDNHFDERMENRRGVYSEDKIAQLDLFYEFEQEDRERKYDTDYFDAPADGYESMSFEEKNYMYFFSRQDSEDDE